MGANLNHRSSRTTGRRAIQRAWTGEADCEEDGQRYGAEGGLKGGRRGLGWSRRKYNQIYYVDAAKSYVTSGCRAAQARSCPSKQRNPGRHSFRRKTAQPAQKREFDCKGRRRNWHVAARLVLTQAAAADALGLGFEDWTDFTSEGAAKETGTSARPYRPPPP